MLYIYAMEKVKKICGRYFFLEQEKERMCVYSPVDSTKTLVVLSLQKLSRRLVSCRQCTHVQCIRAIYVITSQRNP